MSTETQKSLCFIIVVICFLVSTILNILKDEEIIKLKQEVCQFKGGTLVEKICVKGTVIK